MPNYLISLAAALSCLYFFFRTAVLIATSALNVFLTFGALFLFIIFIWGAVSEFRKKRKSSQDYYWPAIAVTLLGMWVALT